MDKETKVFVDCFNKNWLNISKHESEILDKRQSKLNDKFIFTPEVIEKLRRLNTILSNKQLEIRNKADNIITIQNELSSKNTIEDYNYDVELEFYSNTGFYEQYDEEFEGNPFYSDHSLHLFSGLEKKETFFTDNWNEFASFENHPLANEFYCYLFKHISRCGYLAWEDILRIDQIWVEIIVTNQFVININNE